MTAQPPQVFRIKRRRNEEPLPALVLEGTPSRKKSRTSDDCLFRLAETTTQEDTSQAVLNPDSSAPTGGRRTFIVPKSVIKGSTGEDQVNPELLDMVNEYLHSEEGSKPEIGQMKRRKSSVSGQRPQLVSDKRESTPEDVEEFVYDVYYRDSSGVSSKAILHNVGYVRWADDDLDLIDDEPDTTILEDDEDSNSEGYYQNDYPEDEVASEASEMSMAEPSDDQDDEFEIANDGKRFTPLDYASRNGINTSTVEYDQAVDDSVAREDMMDTDEGKPQDLRRIGHR